MRDQLIRVAVGRTLLEIFEAISKTEVAYTYGGKVDLENTLNRFKYTLIEAVGRYLPDLEALEGQLESIEANTDSLARNLEVNTTPTARQSGTKRSTKRGKKTQ